MKETTGHESKYPGESGWEKCERHTRLSALTGNPLGGLINLFCEGAGLIDRAFKTAPKENDQEKNNVINDTSVSEDFETKLSYAFYGAVGKCKEAVKKEDFKVGAEKDFSDMVKADANERPFSIICKVTEESKESKKFSITLFVDSQVRMGSSGVVELPKDNTISVKE